jgi:DNA-binding transcriptional LysR family regulator
MRAPNRVGMICSFREVAEHGFLPSVQSIEIRATFRSVQSNETMTLEQLRIFVAVAEREHLTQAAGTLNLTPSAVSSAIHVLENRYETALFHRVGRRIELTEAGRVFLGEAQATLARAEAAELVLSELGTLKRGSLTVQASQTIASYWLPQRIVRFHDRHPAIDVRLSVGNTDSVTRAVLEGAAEVGLVEGDIDEPALSVRRIARDRLIIVVAPGHPWAGVTTLPSAELRQAPWILREPGSGTRSVFEAALRQIGIDPATLTVAVVLPSNEAVLSAVEVGGSVGVMSELVAAAHIAAGRLIPVPFDIPRRDFQLLRHKERYRTKASLAFEAVLIDRQLR